jgi:hypothetical protein
MVPWRGGDLPTPCIYIHYRLESLKNPSFNLSNLSNFTSF